MFRERSVFALMIPKQLSYLLVADTFGDGEKPSPQSCPEGTLDPRANAWSAACLGFSSYLEAFPVSQ